MEEENEKLKEESTRTIKKKEERAEKGTVSAAEMVERCLNLFDLLLVSPTNLFLSCSLTVVVVERYKTFIGEVDMKVKSRQSKPSLDVKQSPTGTKRCIDRMQAECEESESKLCAITNSSSNAKKSKVEAHRESVPDRKQKG